MARRQTSVHAVVLMTCAGVLLPACMLTCSYHQIWCDPQDATKLFAVRSSPQAGSETRAHFSLRHVDTKTGNDTKLFDYEDHGCVLRAEGAVHARATHILIGQVAGPSLSCYLRCRAQWQST